MTGGRSEQLVDVTAESTRRTWAMRALRWLSPLVIAAVVVVAFSPAFEAEFVSFDDPANVVQNPYFRGLGGQELDWMFRTGHMGHYQPLSWLTLAIDYVRGGEGTRGVLDPAPFHTTNVLLHVLGALAVWALARRFFALAGRGDAWTALVGALCAALLFAIHPLRVESVAWVTERRDVLSAPFFLLAIWCWLRRGGAASAHELSPRLLVVGALAAVVALGLFFAAIDFARLGALAAGPLGSVGLVGSLVAWVVSGVLVARAGPRGSRVSAFLATVLLLVSLLAKAWGIVVLALVLVLDAWHLRRAKGTLPAARAWGWLALEKAPFAALTIAFAALAYWAQASLLHQVKGLGQHGFVERAAQGMYGLAFYAARSLWPTNLSPIYDLPSELSFAEGRFLVPALAVVVVALLLLALRKRLPVLLTAGIAYVVIVSPVLGVLQSGPQLVADRYSYLATIPLALLVGALFERGLAHRLWRPVGLGAAAVVVVLLVVATRPQTRIWHDSRSLWEHALAVEPESPMALLSMGYVCQQEADATQDPARKRALLDEAMRLFVKGQALQPEPKFLANMAVVESILSNVDPANAARHREQALDLSQRAVAFASKRGAVDAELVSNHGMHLLNTGRVQRALQISEQYARANPRSATGQFRYGMALFAADRLPEAAQAFQRGLELEPWNESAREMLARTRARQRGGGG